MTELSDLVNHLVNANSNLSAEEISDALISYVFSEEFQVALIGKMASPTKVEIAVKTIRLRRMGVNRRTIEEERLRFIEDFAHVKETIEDDDLIGEMPYHNKVRTDLRFYYDPNPYSVVMDGFPLSTNIIRPPVRGLENITPRSNKMRLDQDLQTIIELEDTESLLSVYAIKDALEATSFYLNDHSKLRTILRVMKSDISKRNEMFKRNVVQDARDFLNSVPSDKQEEKVKKQSPIQEQIYESATAIILNELDIVSEKITTNFLDGNISYEDFLTRKARIFEDANVIWPEYE